MRFASLATALADLLDQASLPAFERRVRRYTDPDVLILDELGYLPCDSRAADTLYNIVSRRHEKRSTIESWRETHGLDDTDPPPAPPPSRRRRHRAPAA